jgi:hypothetical protein
MKDKQSLLETVAQKELYIKKLELELKKYKSNGKENLPSSPNHVLL